VAWLDGVRAGLRAHFGDPENRVVWSIVLLAATLRLGHLDLIPFKAKQARALLRGLRIVDDLLLPLVGTKSAGGIAEPPGMSLIVAFPLLLGRDPRIVSAFLSLLNVAAVLGCYRLARRYYGLRPAVISATLFAVNPWAVFLSREISSASVLAPLSVLFLYGLCVALLDRRPWGWVLTCGTLGLVLNVSLLSLPLVFVLALLMIVYHRRVCWPEALLGLAAGAIICIPYLYYEYGHGFGDIRALVSSLHHASGWLGSAARAMQWAGWAHSGCNLSSLAGVAKPRYLLARPPLAWLDNLIACVLLASLVGVALLAIRAWSRWKERQDPAKYLILAVWLWVPLLVMPAILVAAAPHGMVILWPAGFLAMGLGLDWLMGACQKQGARLRGWRALGQLGLLVGALLVVARQADSVVYLQKFVAEHDTTGGFGVPYRYWRATAEAVRREVVAVGTDQVWIVAQGSDATRDEQPLVLDYLLQPEAKTVFLGHGSSEALLLPAAQPGVYLLMRESPLVGRTIEDLGGEDRGLVVFPGDERGARVKVVASRPPEEILGLIETRTFQVLDSGLCLLGYDLPSEAKAGQTLHFASYWTFLDLPPQEASLRHSLFNHLHASSGPLVAQCYGFGLHERYWNPGLVLVQWFDMPLPANLPEGDYTLLTGMYRLSDLSRNRCLDDLGNDAGDAIRLGPLHVGEGRAGETR